MATASSFSYAQAAKGQGGPTSQQPSTNGQNEISAAAASSDNATSTTESLPDVPSSISSVDAQATSQEKLDNESVSAPDSEAHPESTQGRSSDSKKDEELGRLERPWRRNDRGTRSSSTTTRSVDEQESRRPRKGKKGKTAEKQSGESNSAQEQETEQEPEQPKIELSEAPIPSVNIWHQRKEAQLAKTKPTDGESTEVASKPAEDTRAAVPDVNGAKPQDKVNESSRVERNGSRGSRVASKEAKSAVPPPVQDAALWPTVETAIKEDKKKSTDTKTERSDKEVQDESAQSKQARSKKEWVAYDYVPTVNFETQLPPIRGTKPRGGAKGASGGRATTGAQPTEKGSAVVANKANEPKDKSKEAVNAPSRAAVVPPPSKRPSGEGVANRSEQRRHTLSGGPEKAKDTPNQQNEQAHVGREGRSERGRGGFRGRAGHHAVNPHAQHQHSASAASFQGQASVASRSQGHYSPPTRQGAHSQAFIPAAQRGGRGARNGNNWHRASLPNGATRPAPVQTQYPAPAYEYPVQPMSAVPFQQPPYWDSMVVSMLRSQIEYYFSIENLCKDMYLRRRMDSQGFVPLLFITAFKRMRELSPDTSLIRSVCEEVNEIDFVIGEDDCERVRRRHGWASFVLPMEERDELARNHGPQHLTYKSRSYNYNPQYNGVPPVPYGMPSPHGFPAQGLPVADDQSFKGINGLPNGNGAGHGVNSSLSADVPDFAPSFGGEEQVNLEVQSGLTNGHFVPAAVNGLPNGVHSQE
ncbi:unnamed protein product [Clonostachys rhizophaga]|uniref:HTH La-type RNA-binding domain-containing protein n=1 Tax=Clonostachys rhizophaga TaxID=160324 RepID=A0A9N9YIN7_9HYPO|nr:unnamed protein product [Clonostachys rhizophaga]